MKSYCTRPDCTCTRATCYEVESVGGETIHLRSTSSGVALNLNLADVRQSIDTSTPLRVPRGSLTVSTLRDLLSDCGL